VLRPLTGRDANEIADALTRFINANIMARGRPIGPDDTFERAGIDSMGILKVLLFIEAEFGFWMPDEDFLEENAASPRALGTYVSRRLKAS
jgi:acyl carrier protein